MLRGKNGQKPHKDEGQLPDQDDLHEWLNALPLAHTGELSRRLFNTLKQLQEDELEPKRHLPLLEGLQQPLEICQKNLGRKYRHQPMPIPGKAMQTFHLVTALHHAMAVCYLRIIDGSNSSRWLLGPKQQARLALCAVRAWEHLGYVLADYRHFNLPTPAQLWRQAYRLLGRVQQLRLEQHRHKQLNKRTPLNEFITQVVLSQIPEQQLNHAQLLLLNDNIRGWVAGLRLEKADGAPPRASIDIDLDSDRAPSSPMDAEGDNPARAARPVRINLEKMLKRVKKDNDTDPELRELIQRCLSADTVRKARKAGSGEYTLINGISALFQTLARREQYAHLLSAEEEEQEQEIVLQDVWVAHTNSMVPVYGLAPRHWSKRYQSDEPPYQARLMNDSEGGLCVSINKPDSAFFHTGAVVGIERVQGDTRLGMIRWIRPDNSELKLGIEWLADKPHPVEIIIGEGEEESQQAALLAFNEHHGLVIVPRLPGLSEKKLALQLGGKRLPIDTRQLHASSKQTLIFNSPIADEALESIAQEADALLQKVS